MQTRPWTMLLMMLAGWIRIRESAVQGDENADSTLDNAADDAGRMAKTVCRRFTTEIRL